MLTQLTTTNTLALDNEKHLTHSITCGTLYRGLTPDPMQNLPHNHYRHIGFDSASNQLLRKNVLFSPHAANRKSK